jgi:hypothetical protein
MDAAVYLLGWLPVSLPLWWFERASILENRGDYSAHAADDGNEQREQDMALPVDLGVEGIEAPVDAREPQVHSLFELFEAPVHSRLEARHRFTDAIDHVALLFDSAFQIGESFIDLVHRAPLPYRRPRHAGNRETTTQE